MATSVILVVDTLGMVLSSSLLGSGIYSYVQSYRGYRDHGQGDDMAVLKLYTPLGDSLGWFGSKIYDDDWDKVKRNFLGCCRDEQDTPSIPESSARSSSANGCGRARRERPNQTGGGITLSRLA